MSLIVRAIKTDIMHARGFCGSARKMRSHYETLRISPSASQQDIRLAFLKLSKEMHPDISKKTNHTDFIKISEAYNVLSKPYTRQQYDTDLKYQKASQGRRVRVVYYDNEKNSDRSYEMHAPYDRNDPSYVPFGVRAGKSVSKLTIVVCCLLLSAFGVTGQMLLINTSMAFNREGLLAESNKRQEAYDATRAEAERTSLEEQIAAFERRSAASRAEEAARYGS